MRTLNLGILAHVDAGKTTLTERLLYAAGAIPRFGSVDTGTTQTDSLALERARGITIRAAVAAFTLDDTTVQLIDTPGHPDFIAEVERSLAVLDAAVLVVSAVEGVQAQTVVLMRALHRLGVPTLVLVNKIDRRGADPDAVLTRIRERLSPVAVPLGTVARAGERDAAYLPWSGQDPVLARAVVEVLAERDETLLAAAVEEAPLPSAAVLHRLLVDGTATGGLVPVLFGSAATGAGAPELLSALRTLLPAAPADAGAPLAAAVFQIARTPTGEKVAYARIFAGTLRRRDRVELAGGPAVVTRIRRVTPGGQVEASEVSAGEIGVLSGLRPVRVGDALGRPWRSVPELFAPPTLETVVAARQGAQQAALAAALSALAEQDPLFDVRQDEEHRLVVSLYGPVQQEVLEHALTVERGIAVDFRATRTICIERLAGPATALLRLDDPGNPYVATLGLHVAPGPEGAGVEVRIETEVTSLPLYVYKSVDAMRAAMLGYVSSTLARGPHGWAVHDVVVTVVACGYSSPTTSAADLRDLTPLVLRTALERAGTVVCEPVSRFRLDAPADALPGVLRLLTASRARPDAPDTVGRWCTVTGEIATAEVPAVQRALAGRTSGEGVLETHFARYAPAGG